MQEKRMRGMGEKKKGKERKGKGGGETSNQGRGSLPLSLHAIEGSDAQEQEHLLDDHACRLHQEEAVHIHLNHLAGLVLAHAVALVVESSKHRRQLIHVIAQVLW